MRDIKGNHSNHQIGTSMDKNEDTIKMNGDYEFVGDPDSGNGMPVGWKVDVSPEAEAARRLQDQLTDWWMNRAHGEVVAVAPKAVEYGATDLAEIGRTMGLIIGRENLSTEEATEVGIYFYVLGKMARWTAAIREGRRVSDDTLLDISIYVKMQQRNRDVGGWPFAPETENQ
jgi:hypothetical protein